MKRQLAKLTRNVPKNLKDIKNKKMSKDLSKTHKSQTWWHMPLVPTTPEVRAVGPFEPRNLSSMWEIV
jgi:hypothetical protein